MNSYKITIVLITLMGIATGISSAMGSYDYFMHADYGMFQAVTFAVFLSVSIFALWNIAFHRMDKHSILSVVIAVCLMGISISTLYSNELVKIQQAEDDKNKQTETKRDQGLSKSNETLSLLIDQENASLFRVQQKIKSSHKKIAGYKYNIAKKRQPKTNTRKLKNEQKNLDKLDNDESKVLESIKDMMLKLSGNQETKGTKITSDTGKDAKKEIDYFVLSRAAIWDLSNPILAFILQMLMLRARQEKQAEAEGIKNKAERAKKQAEKIKKQAEHDKQQAEKIKLEAENLKQQAEVDCEMLISRAESDAVLLKNKATQAGEEIVNEAKRRGAELVDKAKADIDNNFNRHKINVEQAKSEAKHIVSDAKISALSFKDEANNQAEKMLSDAMHDIDRRKDDSNALIKVTEAKKQTIKNEAEKIMASANISALNIKQKYEKLAREITKDAYKDKEIAKLEAESLIFSANGSAEDIKKAAQFKADNITKNADKHKELAEIEANQIVLVAKNDAESIIAQADDEAVVTKEAVNIEVCQIVLIAKNDAKRIIAQADDDGIAIKESAEIEANKQSESIVLLATDNALEIELNAERKAKGIVSRATIIFDEMIEDARSKSKKIKVKTTAKLFSNDDVLRDIEDRKLVKNNRGELTNACLLEQYSIKRGSRPLQIWNKALELGYIEKYRNAYRYKAKKPALCIVNS